MNKISTDKLEKDTLKIQITMKGGRALIRDDSLMGKASYQQFDMIEDAIAYITGLMEGCGSMQDVLAEKVAWPVVVLQAFEDEEENKNES